MTEIVENEKEVAPSELTAAVGVLGGRLVDSDGVNNGLIRCPRCTSRILTKAGTLVKREGKDQIFFLPTRPDGGDDNNDDFVYKEQVHEYWWRVADTDMFDNLGLSRVVDTPGGRMKFIICSDCGMGPIGYQAEKEPELWVCCSALAQQDAALANDAEDFRPPPGLSAQQLAAMMAAGGATVQFDVVFEEQRLGMCLSDTADKTAVEVHAFTTEEGVPPGPAQTSGEIQIGDRVKRVNGKSTAGLNYRKVLDLIINAPRPLTLHFERDGRAAAAPQVRVVPHEQYTGESEEEGGEDEKKPAGETTAPK